MPRSGCASIATSRSSSCSAKAAGCAPRSPARTARRGGSTARCSPRRGRTSPRPKRPPNAQPREATQVPPQNQTLPHMVEPAAGPAGDLGELARFRETVSYLNERATTLAGADLFAKVEPGPEGAMRVVATEDLVEPPAGRSAELCQHAAGPLGGDQGERRARRPADRRSERRGRHGEDPAVRCTQGSGPGPRRANQESPMTVKLLDHVNIHTADLAGTVDFYVDVIGLRAGRAADHHRPTRRLALLRRPAADPSERERAEPPRRHRPDRPRRLRDRGLRARRLQAHRARRGVPDQGAAGLPHPADLRARSERREARAEFSRGLIEAFGLRPAATGSPIT